MTVFELLRALREWGGWILAFLIPIVIWWWRGYWDREARRWCPHNRLRCIHGDEIVGSGWKRGHCLDCGRWFDDLPPVCSWTGEPHGRMDPMTECNGCGRCCDPVVLPFSPIQIETSAIEMVMTAEDVRWMREDLEPIKRREGVALVADYMKGGGKTQGAAGLTGEPQVMFSFFYRCRNYEPETRRCLAYDHRPPACSGYPWGGDRPDPSKALPLECSFRADIGQPVKLITKPERRTS